MLSKRFILSILLIISICLSPVASKTTAEKNQLDVSGFVNKDVTFKTNLHFTGKYCDECHEKIPGKDKAAHLKFGGDFTQLCRCHGYTPATYIHPVEIEPSKEKKARIPKDFPLKNGKITCTTCHDIYKQCQENPEFVQTGEWERRYYRLQMLFLRGDVKKRTDICFKCHEEQKYQKLNPHMQRDEKGKIIPEICLYCHVEKPDEKTADYKDVKLIGDLKMICQRCHGDMIRHPGGIDHYRVPSTKMYIRMQMLEDKFETVLPLDEEGKLTCITCHNPHEKGVIPKGRRGAKGASENYRHRLPKILCQACHGKLEDLY
ncbi:MAG: hypothetical protein HZB61_13010 [Nitrospirae bacterium]|nr:hypothetical protein [Nitrospirota bacterium]